MGRNRGRTEGRGKSAPAPGRVRIIGGAWRGRRLSVPPLAGLRPTADRVRETLFNWLAPELAGARCLDLFAGSGALGLEALSRGAAGCDFVETQAPAVSALRAALGVLGAEDRGSVHAIDALSFLAVAAATPWDIVFLDPPFDSDLLDDAVAALLEGQHLAAGALVYIEHSREQGPTIPPSLSLHRQQQTPALVYALYRHDGEAGHL